MLDVSAAIELKPPPPHADSMQPEGKKKEGTIGCSIGDARFFGRTEPEQDRKLAYAAREWMGRFAACPLRVRAYPARRETFGYLTRAYLRHSIEYLGRLDFGGSESLGRNASFSSLLASLVGSFPPKSGALRRSVQGAGAEGMMVPRSVEKRRGKFKENETLDGRHAMADSRVQRMEANLIIRGSQEQGKISHGRDGGTDRQIGQDAGPESDSSAAMI